MPCCRRICLVALLMIACKEPAEECGQWTDFADSFGIDPSQAISCGTIFSSSTEPEIAEREACLQMAYEEGQLAQLREHHSEEGSQADVVTTENTYYVRPPGQEPRFLRYLQVSETWEDNTTTTTNWAWACDAVIPCDSGVGICCDGWQELCP